MNNSKFKTSARFKIFKDELRKGDRSVLCQWQAINDAGGAIEGYMIHPERIQFIVLHLVQNGVDHGFILFNQTTSNEIINLLNTKP